MLFLSSSFFFLRSPSFCFRLLYLRHISHEIRTPLNITAVGMDITATELKKLGDKVPAFLLSTVESCQEACASSLEVRACMRGVYCVYCVSVCCMSAVLSICEFCMCILYCVWRPAPAR
jgi:hypothetical protein